MPKESYFASQMRQDFLDRGWFFYKIPDTPSVKELHFSPVKLFDAFALKNGMFVAIEFKMAKGTSFPFSQVRDSQVKALQDIEKAGGVAYLFLNHRHNGSNNVIVWRIDDFIMLCDLYAAKDRKSIPLQNYPKPWVILGRTKMHTTDTNLQKTGWDLRQVTTEIEEHYDETKTHIRPSETGNHQSRSTCRPNCR